MYTGIMRVQKLIYLALAAILTLVPRLVPAAEWNASLSDASTLPPGFIAIDKQKQILSVLARQDKLSVTDKYACTTGQKDGSKLHEGDLKTPEGIYFVVTKLDRGLDFAEYGGIAYTLNYPNPVDRMLGKTGYGIWIHSRGRAITSMETRGCIVVNLDDIAALGKYLPGGTAVMVANSIAADAVLPEKTAVAGLLEQKTKDWNAAWASRSSAMFDFYNQEAYSRATESFAAFKAQKEYLFGFLPWIHIIPRNIRVMEGPDYWVTWFEQCYRAPNLSVEGIRRLYWQATPGGEYVIVGMEWLHRDLGMRASYTELITPSISEFVENWRKVWQEGNIEKYADNYAPQASQGGQRGPEGIANLKREMWKRARPAEIKFSDLRIMPTANHVRVDMVQNYSDTSGYADKGIKTLLLYPRGDSWIIVSEDWKRQN
jgi:murein L,D-transpeptidase YafK